MNVILLTKKKMSASSDYKEEKMAEGNKYFLFHSGARSNTNTQNE